MREIFSKLPILKENYLRPIQWSQDFTKAPFDGTQFLIRGTTDNDADFVHTSCYFVQVSKELASDLHQRGYLILNRMDEPNYVDIANLDPEEETCGELQYKSYKLEYDCQPKFGFRPHSWCLLENIIDPDNN